MEDAERTILEVDGKFGSTTCNTLVGSGFKDADDTLTRLNPTFKEDSTDDIDERDNAKLFPGFNLSTESEGRSRLGDVCTVQIVSK